MQSKISFVPHEPAEHELRMFTDYNYSIVNI